MNVTDYLKRIKYFGKTHATLEVLRELSWHHVCHVPFDTIGLHSGPRKVMEIENLYKSIVSNNRGGFCFELNGLFHWLLQQLGFNAIILQAQAYLDGNFSGDFGHLTILVTFGMADRWLVDVAVLPNPINLDESTEQIAKNSLYRIVLMQSSHDTYYYLEKYKRQTVSKTESNLVEMGDKLEELSKKFNSNKHADSKSGKWEYKLRFHTIPAKLCDFQEMMDFHQQSHNSEFAHNSFCVLHKHSGFIALWGTTLVQKHYIDHYTEVLCAVNLCVNSNEQTIREVLENVFMVKVSSNLDLHQRDLKKLL